MIGDGPIRIAAHEWVIIRNNPRFPKALVRRIDPGMPTEHYRVVSFELEPADRILLGRFRTLEAANDSVLYEIPESSNRAMRVHSNHGAPGYPPL